jgi:hypothetical protein
MQRRTTHRTNTDRRRTPAEPLSQNEPGASQQLVPHPGGGKSLLEPPWSSTTRNCRLRRTASHGRRHQRQRPSRVRKGSRKEKKVSPVLQSPPCPSVPPCLRGEPFLRVPSCPSWTRSAEEGWLKEIRERHGIDAPVTTVAALLSPLTARQAALLALLRAGPAGSITATPDAPTAATPAGAPSPKRSSPWLVRAVLSEALWLRMPGWPQ